jgi:hypothetical protein
VKLFVKTAMTLPIMEFVSLLDLGYTVSKLYLYDPDQLTAWRVPSGLLAWPAEFVACYHPKHIFAPKRAPTLQHLSEQLNTFCNKVRWAYLFQNAPEDEFRYLRDRRPTKPCPHPLPGPCDSLLVQAVHEVLDQGIRARTRAIKTRQFTRSRIIDIGLLYWKRSNWGLVPTDKDGGFAIVDKHKLQSSMTSMLDTSPNYIRKHRSHLLHHDILAEYVGAVKSFTRNEEDPSQLQLQRALLSSVRGSSELSAFCKLQVTVKTHKNPGQVKYRAIHACPASPLAPGMRYLTFMIEQTLRSLPHLAADSKAVARLLDTTQVPRGSTIYKLDIAEFFMSGKHGPLIKHAATCVPSDKVNEFICLAEVILSTQYLTCNGTDDVWQVTTGSGMGLILSAAISNAAFYDKAERWATSAEVKSRYHIHLYIRYQDDILIVLSGSMVERLNFMKEFRVRSSFFQIKIDSVSSDEVNMLDMRVFFGDRHRCLGFLDYHVVEKPTSIAKSLKPTSQHPWSVHRSWPQGLLNREFALSSSRSTSILRCDLLRARWNAAGVLIPQCRDHTTPRRQLRSRKVRLILDYSLPWRHISGPLHRALQIISRMSWPFELQFGLAWRCGAPHIAKLLKSFNQAYHEHHAMFSPWI